MSSDLHHTRRNIIELSRVNDIVKSALDVYNITSVAGRNSSWEKALILAVIELVKRNSRLETENLKLLVNRGAQIVVDFGTLNKEVRQQILDLIKGQEGR